MTMRESSRWRRWLAAALLAAPLLATAQADPPARVAYISAQEGAAQLATDGRNFAPAGINWPVTNGTRIVTDPNGRTELHSGSLAIRLTRSADLSVTELDDDTAQVALMDGSVSLRVRQLRPGERVEVDTPQLAVVATQPGEYRIDVDPRTDTTRLTVHSGAASAYGESGQVSNVGARQQVLYSGRALVVTQAGPAQRDAFDQWVAARDALEDRSASAQFVPRDLPGYQQLDAYGEWSQDATYGAVWYPQVTVADWAPYRYGRWAWVEPWGWTWIDDAPWGFAPSHYGRWAQIGPRWAWVPGRFGPRPVYAPALVAFMGDAAGGGNWGVSLGGGPGAAWFPLAPGEYWTPNYHASDRYRGRLNWGDGRYRTPNVYHFQHRPNAISVAPVDQFGGDRGRRPHFGDANRLPPGLLDGGRVVPPPPRGWAPGPQTQAPRPTPRPEVNWQGDPRRPRPDFDRGVAPLPVPTPGARVPRGDDVPRVVPPAMRPRPESGALGDRPPRQPVVPEMQRPCTPQPLESGALGDPPVRPMQPIYPPAAAPQPPREQRPAPPMPPQQRPWSPQPGSGELGSQPRPMEQRPAMPMREPRMAPMMEQRPMPQRDPRAQPPGEPRRPMRDGDERRRFVPVEH